MRRRLLIASAAWPAFAWTGAARAEAKPPLVSGWLQASARDADVDSLNAFHEGMAALGWKLGAHYVLEERWTDGRIERLPALAQELAVKKPVVIVALGSTPRFAAKVARLAKDKVQALVVLSSAWFQAHRRQIMKLALVQRWPVPLTKLVIIGHSMGGLVARSACHYAYLARHQWLHRLDKLMEFFKMS